MSEQTVVILSGGLDSAVLMYNLLGDGHVVKALSFDYGQRHVRELAHASVIADLMSVEHKVINLVAVRDVMGGSSQTDQTIDVPDGHYTDESMRVTVVPNRNMIMLAVAAAWAMSTGSDHVAFAAHGGDHAIYPDCRREFVDAMTTAIQRVTAEMYPPINVIAPYLYMSKADVVKIGAKLDVPFHRTWSCYKGGAVHCGSCGTCVERMQAFIEAGVHDPTTYEPGNLGEALRNGAASVR